MLNDQDKDLSRIESSIALLEKQVRIHNDSNDGGEDQSSCSDSDSRMSSFSADMQGLFSTRDLEDLRAEVFAEARAKIEKSF